MKSSKFIFFLTANMALYVAAYFLCGEDSRELFIALTEFTLCLLTTIKDDITAVIGFTPNILLPKSVINEKCLKRKEDKYRGSYSNGKHLDIQFSRKKKTENNSSTTEIVFKFIKYFDK